MWYVYLPEFSNDSIYIGDAAELRNYTDMVDGSLARLLNGTVMADRMPLAGGNGSANRLPIISQCEGNSLISAGNNQPCIY